MGFRLILLGCVTLLALAGCCAPKATAGRVLAGPVSDYAVLKDYQAGRVSSEDRPGNGDFRPIPPGEVLTVAEIEGPAEITHIWCTISTPDPLHLRKMVLRVYYDGNEFPSVESPIGDFFGLGHARYYMLDNTTQAIGTINGMNSFWPMPFRKSARITVTNESTERVNAFYYYVDYRKFNKMPQNVGYFHAQYRQAFPAPNGKPYLLLETEGGRGHYMGVNMSIHTQTGGWWGEGDDIFTIDGEVVPSLWGTGSEDYFCGAWCYGETFYNNYFGMPYREKPTHDQDNYWNVYRYHVENPIPFEKSLKVEIEHGAWGFDNTRAGGWNNDHSSCAYWYMDKPVKLIGELPPVEQRLPKFRPRLAPGNMLENNGAKFESSSAGAFTQAMDNFQHGKWFFHDQLFCDKNSVGSKARLTFSTTEPLNGEAVIALTQANDYGVLRISLNGRVLVGRFDGYNPEVRSVIVPVGNIKLDAGEQVLEIETIGRNEKTRNVLWGFDYLRIGGEKPESEFGQAVVKAE